MHLRLTSWIETLAGFLYPNVCQICHSETAKSHDGYICGRCWEAVRFITAPYCERCGLPFEGEITTHFVCSNCRDLAFCFSYARASVAAKTLVLDVIHRYKYQRALWFEPFLADLFLRQAAAQLSSAEWNLIVPVPLHPMRKREREFNQAERLAAHLGSATSIPIRHDLLHRISATRTQTTLTRVQRAENVRSAFAFAADRKLEGERVILVDDVFTTGATTNACAKVLRDHGAGEVCVWTVARGL